MGRVWPRGRVVASSVGSKSINVGCLYCLLSMSSDWQLRSRANKGLPLFRTSLVLREEKAGAAMSAFRNTFITLYLLEDTNAVKCFGGIHA